MIRRITYRTAVHAFVFTALWFIIGAVVLWSPVPGALGIASAMFGAWLLLFFAMLAVSGASLTFAAINAAFPPRRTTRSRRPMVARAAGEPMWAPDGRAARPRTGAEHRGSEG